jgi:exonuclease III
MSFKIKGGFWNSNGLRDQAKPRFLFDTTKEQQLDFIALLETKRSEFNANELSHFCANKIFIWEWSPPNGRSGGILVGFNQDKFDVLHILHGDFSLKFKLRNKEE